MHDLRSQIGNLYRTAARQMSPDGCRSIMFVSARRGEGASSMATSFALLAAARAARTAWLVDLDLRNNPLSQALDDGFADDVGPLGRAYDGSLNVDPIYSVTQDISGREAGNKLLVAQQVEETRLLVTRFRDDLLRDEQQVRIISQPTWWSRLKEATDWIVVDAPAFETSTAVLTVANQVDGIVLVVNADSTSVEDVAGLRLELESYGGNVIGVAMNRVGADARLLDKIGL